MKQIKLTQGKFVSVDDTDYEWLNQYKWYAGQIRHTYYAMHNVSVTKNKRITECMHRLILGLQPGDKRQADHIDGHGLNNQRANLRVCTITNNNRSRRKRAITISRYKGVTWNHHRSKWYSQIRDRNGKKIHLGSYDSEVDAAQAYDAAAIEYHFEFALTNKMLGLI